MKNSKFVFDKITKLFEEGLVSSRDLANELITILKSKRDEIVFKMKLTSKDEFEVLSKRVENLEKKLDKFESDCTDVILINEWWQSPRNPCEYYKVPEVSKFITGKDLTLICTPCIGDLSSLIRGIEEDHNVKNKFNTVFPPGSGTDRDCPAQGNFSCFRK